MYGFVQNIWNLVLKQMDRWDWQLELHLTSFYKLDKTAAKLTFSADEVEGLNSKSDMLHKIDREFEF